MSFSKKTIRDVDIRGKRLLIRADYNVLVDTHGAVLDDRKLRASLPTIQYALEQDAAVVLCSHLGRPEGAARPELSLFPVAKRLQELLGRDITFVPECVGERAAKAAGACQSGQVVLLENLRFDAREELNDDDFAAQLAGYADVFVQDGFAVVYRRHASVDAVTRHLPSVAGLLVESELCSLETVLSSEAKRPVIAVIGGRQVSEMFALLEHMLRSVDVVAVGGPIAVAFLHEAGITTGKTEVSEADKPLVRQLLALAVEQRRERGVSFVLPYDAVVARSDTADAKTRIVDWSAHVIADIESYPKRPLHEASQVAADEQILDIGPFTGAYLAGLIQFAGTVLWCGALGRADVTGQRGPVGPFAHGSELLAEALSGQFGKRPAYTVVAGDEAAEYLKNRGIVDIFDHVSTGGGASLEVLAGRSLIGIDVLEDI